MFVELEVGTRTLPAKLVASLFPHPVHQLSITVSNVARSFLFLTVNSEPLHCFYFGATQRVIELDNQRAQSGDFELEWLTVTDGSRW